MHICPPGGVSYVMKEVTKIILGASSMMANGAAASRVGTACVAMMAKNYHKPVIFCCETYKFTPRVQLDSIVDNEMLDPNEVSNCCAWNNNYYLLMEIQKSI